MLCIVWIYCIYNFCHIWSVCSRKSNGIPEYFFRVRVISCQMCILDHASSSKTIFAFFSFSRKKTRGTQFCERWNVHFLCKKLAQSFALASFYTVRNIQLCQNLVKTLFNDTISLGKIRKIWTGFKSLIYKSQTLCVCVTT